MVTPDSTVTAIDNTTRIEEGFHSLSDKWSLWAHLPHDTDWSLNSYKNIYTFDFKLSYSHK